MACRVYKCYKAYCNVGEDNAHWEEEHSWLCDDNIVGGDDTPHIIADTE